MRRSTATGTQKFAAEFYKICELMAGTRPTAVRLLGDGRLLDPSTGDDWLEVTVPEVACHEIVAVDLAAAP